MPLHQIKLSDLMAAGSHSPSFERDISRACSDPSFVTRVIVVNPIMRLEGAVTEFRFRMQEIECGIEGYTMTHDASSKLLAAFDASGSLAGGVTSKSILVLPDHRGQGLGAEIVIRAFESGVMHPDTMNVQNLLTTAGRANRMAAHRIAVERAVKAGLEVAPEILADYADVLHLWTSTPSFQPPRPGF